MPRGQTAHLLGKRTGRPKGTGHRSRLLPDLRWAYETIADPKARPPTAGAQYCKDLALREPVKFLALLGDLEVRESSQAPRPTDKRQAVLAFPTDAGRKANVGIEYGVPRVTGGPPQWVKMMLVHWNYILRALECGTGPPVTLANLPSDYKVVAGAVDLVREGLILIVRSNTFAPVGGGDPIPEIKAEYE